MTPSHATAISTFPRLRLLVAEKITVRRVNIPPPPLLRLSSSSLPLLSSSSPPPSSQFHPCGRGACPQPSRERRGRDVQMGNTITHTITLFVICGLYNEFALTRDREQEKAGITLRFYPQLSSVHPVQLLLLDTRKLGSLFAFIPSFLLFTQ